MSDPVWKIDATLYRSIVGGLRYLIHTGSDIAFVVGYVSLFMEDPREDYWATVKRLLRYVKGTVDQVIVFPKTGGSRLQLTVFSDADMRGGHRRTAEHLWRARLPRVGFNLMAVAETEYGGAVHVRGRVRGGGHSGVPSCMAAPAAGRADRCGSSPTSTDGGQPSAIALAKNPVLHDRSKHIDVKFHFLWDCVDGGQIARVRRNWSATRGRPHQAVRPSSVHGVEKDDRHDGGSSVSSRIKGRIVK